MHFLLLSVNWSNCVFKYLPPMRLKNNNSECIPYILYIFFFPKLSSVQFIHANSINIGFALLDGL